MEGLLDGRDGAGDVEIDAIGRGCGNGEAVLLGEIDDGVVVVFGGAELRGKLLDGEEMVVAGTGGIVEIVEEGIEFRLIAERQSDGEAEGLRGGQLSDGFGSAGFGFVADVMGEEGLGLSKGRKGS